MCSEADSSLDLATDPGSEDWMLSAWPQKSRDPSGLLLLPSGSERSGTGDAKASKAEWLSCKCHMSNFHQVPTKRNPPMEPP